MIAYEVQDNGIGISVENQKRLFAQFIRLNHDTTNGYGLGLSIVQRLVWRMNGQVGIQSRPGEGSTFRFLLPSVR
jgi:two-component system, sensor histidine kinase and response regulator